MAGALHHNRNPRKDLETSWSSVSYDADLEKTNYKESGPACHIISTRLGSLPLIYSTTDCRVHIP